MPHAAVTTSTEGRETRNVDCNETAALAVAVLEVWSELLELDPCHD